VRCVSPQLLFLPFLKIYKFSHPFPAPVHVGLYMSSSCAAKEARTLRCQPRQSLLLELLYMSHAVRWHLSLSELQQLDLRWCGTRDWTDHWPSPLKSACPYVRLVTD